MSLLFAPLHVLLKGQKYLSNLYSQKRLYEMPDFIDETLEKWAEALVIRRNQHCVNLASSRLRGYLFSPLRR
jgi:hypothetical protein